MQTIESEWTKRNITDDYRVHDMVELYSLLGYEVKVVDFDPAKYPNECNECMNEAPERFKVIYTKPGSLTGRDYYGD